MATYPLIPWEPCNIPDVIQTELNRRKLNKSFNYVSNEKGGWAENNNILGDWRNYKGPTSPWVRFCSNGNGITNNPDNIKKGFVFFSGKDFYSGYGFTGQQDNTSIIGYVPDNTGRIHTIANDLNQHYPIHVPPPEIERIQVTIQKELYRRCTVEWVCFSKAQLEYMTPYFLVPGITCIVEWGWNNYNPESLINLTNITELKNIYNNPYPLYTDNILNSKGNYDVIFGLVTHFEWSVEGNKIKCKTEITSKDRIYAGVIMNSSPVMNPLSNKPKSDKDIQPLDNLYKFIKDVLPELKNLISTPDIINNLDKKTNTEIINKSLETDKPFSLSAGYDAKAGISTAYTPAYLQTSPEQLTKEQEVQNYKIERLKQFLRFLKHRYKHKWKQYAYGIFFGRDAKDAVLSNADFDSKSKNKDMWITLGLLIEIVNFHMFCLKGMSNVEAFRVDIDRVVISGHPNLMSTSRDVLIPNAMSPKYFYGSYGPNYTSNTNTSDKARSEGGWPELKTSTNVPIKVPNDEERAKEQNLMADFRLRVICRQLGGSVYRDNLDELINMVRYKNTESTPGDYAFPFMSSEQVPIAIGNPYPARYSGHLKNIYVNVNYLNSISNIDTYVKFLETILLHISNCCGKFWNFKLVSGTGNSELKKTDLAPMTICDDNFVSTTNPGTVYAFDIFDADSLLLGMSFKPTLSNAMAIRTIYAPSTNQDKKITLTNGNNQLLDYKFSDRLETDDTNKTKDQNAKNANDSSEFKSRANFIETMRDLQQKQSTKDVLQMTTYAAGNTVIRRLILPAPEVLDLLLDDSDIDNNPKYTGIMPGIQATFTIQGIAGLRTFMMFLVRNLPEPYSHENIVFRIVDVQETIENGKWTTNITAGVMPLTKHLKERLKLISTKNSSYKNTSVIYRENILDKPSTIEQIIPEGINNTPYTDILNSMPL